ncbi:hypothetical protein V6N13_140378 [Hibiscus sabdariffa]
MFGKAARTDAFYPVRPECIANVPKSRFRQRAGKTLSARRWHAAFSADGHLDMQKFFDGSNEGIHPSIKGVVCEFLLGSFDPESSFDDRNQLIEERSTLWHCGRLNAKICSVPDKKAAQWMLFLHQIGLDVVRTDRALSFYKSKTNLAKLWDILAVYSWIDDDIGYVQDMQDQPKPSTIANGTNGQPTKEKRDKHKQTKPSSRNSSSDTAC